MKLGLAVVGSDSGTAEQIDDGRTGLLFRSGDAVDLANRVQLLIDDPSLRRTIALDGQLFAVESFSREQFVTAFTDAMSGLTTAKPKRMVRFATKRGGVAEGPKGRQREAR